MSTITILLNSAVMLVFGFASRASQLQVDNVLMHPEAYGDLGQTLPIITVTAIRLRWLWWSVPSVWLLLAGILLLAIRRMESSSANSLVQLHTSATLLIGLSLLLFFALSGVLPFVDLIDSSL